jgi:hypothetical protein
LLCPYTNGDENRAIVSRTIASDREMNISWIKVGKIIL